MTDRQFREWVRKALIARSSRKNKANYEWYFKNAVQFHGVKSFEFRIIARKASEFLTNEPAPHVLSLALSLLKSKYAEEKQIGILVLSRILKSRRDERAERISRDLLKKLDPIFQSSVHDWGTCDSLAGKALRFLVVRDPSDTLKTMLEWSRSDCSWKQRAAAVSLLGGARHGQFKREILEICHNILKNRDRFAQLGAGWVLRELSLADQKSVTSFLRKHYECLNREALRYALEKTLEPRRIRILKEHLRIARARTVQGVERC